MVVSKLYTVEEFEQWLAQPENADRLFELINGEIVEKVPTQFHALIAAALITALNNAARGIAWVFAELRIKLPDEPDNSTIPDIAVVLKAGRSIDRNDPLPYMPDLAIEIQSPGQDDKEMSDKAAYYLARGVRMVWIVYPSKRLVEALTPTSRRLLTEADTLDAGEVLPGFTLPVKDIFQE